jgi:glycosyltransferase involved in cell wall biosynthesis
MTDANFDLPRGSKSTNKSVCIISLSPIYRDARVLRQIEYLSPYYDLTVIGYGRPHSAWKDLQNIHWDLISQFQPTRMSKLAGLATLSLGKLWPSVYDNWYWSKPDRTHALEKAVVSRCDAFHANDWDTLPIAAKAARENSAKLVFDAHEYAPLEWENNWLWRLLYSPAIKYILKKHSWAINASTTVAPLIAERYKNEFSLDPIVVLNTPNKANVILRECDPNNVRLFHHGNAIPDRRLETMIETLALCDQRYTLHFMFVNNDSRYVQRLKNLAAELAPGRVTFHEPVGPTEVVRQISEYDIGFYLLEPNSYNNCVALPNKLFDFIAAGLAVCVGPSPSMAELVRQYGCGCVAPSFRPRNVADTLNHLSADQLASMRRASREAAQQFNASREMGQVIELYRRLFTGGS